MVHRGPPHRLQTTEPRSSSTWAQLEAPWHQLHVQSLAGFAACPTHVKPVETHANPVSVMMLSSYVVAVWAVYVLSAKSATMATVFNANDVASSDHPEGI